MNSLLKIVGGIVFVLGVLLIIGNVTRAFPTFPLAGYITTVIGSLIYGASNKFTNGNE